MKTKQRCHPFHQRFQRPSSALSFAIGATAAFLMALPALAASNVNNAPTLKLFPTTVVESIKETGQSAKAMEESLQGVIQDLEKQMTLYNQSKCAGSQGDEGCQAIARQLSQTYLEMLDRMEARFPDLEVSVRTCQDQPGKTDPPGTGPETHGQGDPEALVRPKRRGLKASQAEKRQAAER